MPKKLPFFFQSLTNKTTTLKTSRQKLVISINNLVAHVLAMSSGIAGTGIIVTLMYSGFGLKRKSIKHRNVRTHCLLV